MLLHGGAIIALLSLLSTIIGHPRAAPVIGVGVVRIAIGVFAAGLVATVTAGACGYFNFLHGQGRDVPADKILENLLVMNRARIWATGLTIASITLFVLGVAVVVIPW